MASPGASFGPATIVLRVVGDRPVISASDGPPGYRYGLPAAAARASDGELVLFIAWFGSVPGDQRVTVSRSMDGRTWEVGHDPIYDDLGLDLANPGPIPQAAVQLEGGSWALFGWGAPRSNPSSFTSWLATAPAPEGPWELRANDLLPLGETGAWDSQTAILSSVQRGVDGGYRGWFDGQAPGSSYRGSIGFATSEDGATWTKRPDPVIAPGFCGAGTSAAAIQPQVERWEDGDLMLFAGHRDPDSRMSVFAATSRDGRDWRCDSSNPALTKDDVPGSLDIHTIKGIELGEGRPGLIIESLGEGHSDLWLAEIAPAVPDVSPAARLPGEVTAMAAGRYRSSPPFDVPFTFEVPDGWTSLHLHGEYVDIGWYAGRTPFGLPDRVLGFARPHVLRGVDGDQPARSLTAAEAMAVFQERSDIVTTEPVPFELDGRAGLRLDVHAPAESTSLLGGDDGTLGVGPAHDSRLAVVPLANEELLVVIVQAPPADLQASWTRIAPILESIDLDDG